jgi:hypothetical protein
MDFPKNTSLIAFAAVVASSLLMSKVALMKAKLKTSEVIFLGTGASTTVPHLHHLMKPRNYLERDEETQEKNTDHQNVMTSIKASWGRLRQL